VEVEVAKPEMDVITKKPVVVVEEEEIKEDDTPSYVKGRPIHVNVQCDICGCNPIVGVRYKCSICNDFDMCASCEKMNKHPVGHPLMKVKIPKVYNVLKGSWRCNKSAEKKVKSDRLFAKFIEDVTIPDRCYLAPSELKKKVWKLRNVGASAWPAGFTICHISGDKDFIPEASLNLSLPEVPSGESVQVELDFVVPEKAGRYISYFRLQDLSGNKFGPRFWMDFYVPEPVVVGAKPAEPLQDEPQWASQLEELETMGFANDRALNIFLLTKFKGDVTRVVNWFLDK